LLYRLAAAGAGLAAGAALTLAGGVFSVVAHAAKSTGTVIAKTRVFCKELIMIKQSWFLS
jgi:hypothetical protein